MENENFKLQMIATQALHKKYGSCPAPEQVKLLESDGEGTYILFRVGEHEYRCDDGKIINIEDQKKSEKALDEYFNMYMEARKYKGLAEDRVRIETQRVIDLRRKNRELTEANKQLKSERDEFIKSWLSAKDTVDERIREMKK